MVMNEEMAPKNDETNACATMAPKSDESELQIVMNQWYSSDSKMALSMQFRY